MRARSRRAVQVASGSDAALRCGDREPAGVAQAGTGHVEDRAAVQHDRAAVALHRERTGGKVDGGVAELDARAAHRHARARAQHEVAGGGGELDAARGEVDHAALHDVAGADLQPARGAERGGCVAGGGGSGNAEAATHGQVRIGARATADDGRRDLQCAAETGAAGAVETKQGAGPPLRDRGLRALGTRGDRQQAGGIDGQGAAGQGCRRARGRLQPAAVEQADAAGDKPGAAAVRGPKQWAVQHEVAQVRIAQRAAGAEVDGGVAAQRQAAAGAEAGEPAGVDQPARGIACAAHGQPLGAQRHRGRIDGEAAARGGRAGAVERERAGAGIELEVLPEHQLRGARQRGAAQQRDIGLAGQAQRGAVAGDAQVADGRRAEPGRVGLGLQLGAVAELQCAGRGQHEIVGLQMRAWRHREAGCRDVEPARIGRSRAGRCAQHQQVGAQAVELGRVEQQRRGIRRAAAQLHGRGGEVDLRSAAGQRVAGGLGRCARRALQREPEVERLAADDQAAGIRTERGDGRAVALCCGAEEAVQRGGADLRVLEGLGRCLHGPGAGQGAAQLGAGVGQQRADVDAAVRLCERGAEAQGRAAGHGAHQVGTVEDGIARRQQRVVAGGNRASLPDHELPAEGRRCALQREVERALQMQAGQQREGAVAAGEGIRRTAGAGDELPGQQLAAAAQVDAAAGLQVHRRCAEADALGQWRGQRAAVAAHLLRREPLAARGLPVDQGLARRADGDRGAGVFADGGRGGQRDAAGRRAYGAGDIDGAGEQIERAAGAQRCIGRCRCGRAVQRQGVAAGVDAEAGVRRGIQLRRRDRRVRLGEQGAGEGVLAVQHPRLQAQVLAGAQAQRGDALGDDALAQHQVGRLEL
ncbi:hypothetical protein ROSA5918_23795 [Roseateles saccharophilus]